MKTINNIELRDENVYPDEKILRKVLNISYESYVRLLDLFTKNELSYEWRYYRDGKAWLCKVQMRKRTIVWISAWNGFLLATIYFPEKYLEKVYDLAISEEVKIKIKSTKYVGKLKPCIFEIRDLTKLNDFSKIMKLKIECK